MSDSESEKRPAGSSQTQPSGRVIDERFLSAAQIPFGISLAAVFAILVLFIIQASSGFKIGGMPLDTDSAFVRFVLPNSLYIALFMIAVLGAYSGFRLVVAAAATSTVVISTTRL
jgi:hypothetical protein